jgi:NDP-sugar pyrophosphorylase family protein
MRSPESYFDLRDENVQRIFKRSKNVWDALQHLPDLVDELTQGRRQIKGTVMPGAVLPDGPLYVGDGAVIEPGTFIAAAAYIGEGVHIRHGAYVRSNCIFLPGSVLGHASEAKSAVFLPKAKAPHFAYVGDSILGHRVNLGAGTKISNLRILTSGSPTICLEIEGEMVDTGLRKLGAVVGDDVQVGCNAVLNPGTLLSPGCIVYAGAVAPKGFHKPRTIIKLRQSLESATVMAANSVDRH